MIWTSPDGLDWELVDWKWRGSSGKKQRLELGALDSDGRAFVPHNREGKVMIADFGRVAYRDTSDRTLADQFRLAKPVDLDAARRYWSR